MFRVVDVLELVSLVLPAATSTLSTATARQATVLTAVDVCCVHCWSAFLLNAKSWPLQLLVWTCSGTSKTRSNVFLKLPTQTQDRASR